MNKNEHDMHTGEIHTSEYEWHTIYTLTVQTFNSCTSRPDVCQNQVVETPMDDMSKNKPSTSMTHVHVVCDFQATFSFEVIHAAMPRKLCGNRACSRVLCPDCPHV